ncbi:MAG: monovalent cation/H+ antiporter subunit D [Gallionellaceae bacterium]|nr:monovalent cation/H+ antiporter subunit D [Gallionellaceae bacterium]
MSHLVIAPLILPLVAGILLLFLRDVAIAWRRALALGATLAQFGLAVLLAVAVNDGTILTYALGDWPAPYGIVLVADRLAAWMVLVTALLAPFPLLHACRGQDEAGRHFHVLYQWQLFGLNGAFLTGDLFNLFVFFEVLLLASYGLVLHGGGRARIRAGLHYVVVNLAGSALFLIAVGTLYGLFGTLNMADLALRMAAADPDLAGPARAAGLLLFAVFALKAALLPLYLWLPRTYAAAAAPVAALFAIMTKVGAYAILRTATLMFAGGSLGGLLDAWLLPLALATLLAGLFGALAARSLGEQAAWLVVASVGTLLTAFGLGSAAGIAAGLYYLPHSTFAAAALFLLADRIGSGRGALADRFEPGPALAGAGWLGGLFFVAAILLTGMPPLSGFVGKFLLLRAALAHPAWPWVLAAVLGGGLLALVALARSGSLLFFRAAGAPAPAAAVPVAPAAALLALGLVLTVAAGPLSDLAAAAAGQLLAPQDYIAAVLGSHP